MRRGAFAVPPGASFTVGCGVERSKSAAFPSCVPFPLPTNETPGQPWRKQSVLPVLVSTRVTSTLPAAPPPPAAMDPLRAEVAHWPAMGTGELLPVGRGEPDALDVAVDEPVGEPEGEPEPPAHPASARASVDAAAAAMRSAAGLREVMGPS